MKFKFTNAVLLSVLISFTFFTRFSNAGIIYAAYEGSQTGVSVRDSSSFNQINSFGTSFTIDGIVAGAGDELYIASNDSIYRYLNDGTLLQSFTWPSGINYSDVTFDGQSISSSYNGVQLGVTNRNADTLVQNSSFMTGINAGSISKGLDSDLYLTSGNNIYNFSNGGSLLNTMTFPNSGINYTDVTVQDGLLVASYGGVANGITIRDADALIQLSYFNLDFSINGIDAGDNSDIFLAGGNSLYKYGLDGSQLNSFTWGDNSIIYTDIAFKDVTSVPEPSTLIVFALGMFGLASRRLNKLS